MNFSMGHNAGLGTAGTRDELRAKLSCSCRRKWQTRFSLANLPSDLLHERMDLKARIAADQARQDFGLLLFVTDDVLPARQRDRNRVRRGRHGLPKLGGLPNRLLEQIARHWIKSTKHQAPSTR